MNLFKVFVIAILTFSLVEKLNVLNDSTELSIFDSNSNRYNCKYSQLSCGCYAKYGGCNVQCSPSVSYMIYNQTSCPSIKNHFLSGFSHL